MAPRGPRSLPTLRDEGMVKVREGLGQSRLSSEPE